MEGYIKLHRKLLENPISSKPNYLSIWLYLLLKANHKDNEIIWNKEKTIIKRGQFIGSIFEISKQFSLSTGTVTYVLNYLKAERMIERLSNKRFTLFTILNYDSYQTEVERTSEIKMKTNEKQNETNNNDKKEKNDKKDTSKEVSNAGIKNRNLELIKYYEEKIGSNLEGSSETNWRYCTHLFNRMKKQFPDKDTIGSIKALIDLGLKDGFHQKNMNGFRYIFNNYLKIIKSYQQEKRTVAII